MVPLRRYRLPFFFAVIFFVVFGTIITIGFASGYRLDIASKTIHPTGLLSATSDPRSAQVFIDGKLKTATNNTLSLVPKEYLVEIKKEGFFPWQKKIKIEKELVVETEAFLFPRVPDLKPLTFTGAQNPQVSPDGYTIIYNISLPNLQAGLWAVDLSSSFLKFGREPRQIVKSSPLFDFAKSEYFWSPDSRQLVVSFTDGRMFFLDTTRLNENSALVDIAETWPQTQKGWQEEENLRQNARLKKLPEKLREILQTKAISLSFSLDRGKILYTATASAEIPFNLIPPLPAASTQKESRKIEANKLYVYDIKEDKNFLIPFEAPKPTPTPKPNKKITPILPLTTDHWPLITTHWFPTSRHIYWVVNNQLFVYEYDGTNLTTVYSGPLTNDFAVATPEASEFIILATLNLEKNSSPNLFSVSLR